MSSYIVTGPLAVIKDSEGKGRYYYGGAALPNDLPKEHVERLVALGLVTKVADPAAPLPDPGAPADKPRTSARPAAVKD